MDQKAVERFRPFRFLQLAFLLSGILAVPATTRASIELNVSRVGFAAQTINVVRAGQWTPVVVDLTLIDQQEFDGSLRVAQLDRDGDETYDEVPVHLRADTGGTQRYSLYTLANPVGNDRHFIVELFDEQGEVVEVVSQGELTDQAELANEIIGIDDDSNLVLSLSSGAAGAERELEDSAIPYRQPIFVSHMEPGDLPDHWIGLEAVDYIVWDDVRPEVLSSRQLEALVQWVDQGGTILLAASRSAGALRMAGALYDRLPVDLGDLATANNLAEARQKFLGRPHEEAADRSKDAKHWWERPLPTAVPVIHCTPRQGATILAHEGTNALLTRKPAERGQVIFLGVLLKDFFSGAGETRDFFQKVFHLTRLSDLEARPSPRSLFGQVVSGVAFATRGFSLLLLAGALSLVYVVVATFGSWQLLMSRGWNRHSWSAFGAVALAASLMSVFSVGAIRGFGGESLHQVSIVDSQVGETSAYASVFFGLKTGLDRRLDLWLPGDPIGATEPYATDCFLRPLPVSGNPLDAASHFADPTAYRIEPASGVLHDVRFRATLKRLEGRWHGRLDGTVSGVVRVARNQRSMILEGSYLVNNLGVDLTGCYLLQTNLDLESTDGPRSTSILAYPLGDIPADGAQFDLATRCNPIDPKSGEPVSRSQFWLEDAQKEWGANFAGLLSSIGYERSSGQGVAVGNEKNALRMLSTIGDFNPQAGANMLKQATGVETFSRDRMRELDLREQLSRDQVILMGFAADPGPVRLFRRTGDRPFRMITPDPERSWTMYRIRIPVTLIGT